MPITSRVPPSYIVIVSILLTFAGIIILWFMGYITFEDLYANFFFLIFQLVTITILAILGAVFLGMLLSHRILSAKTDFSPLEMATMETNVNVKKMQEDIDELRKEVAELRSLVEKK